MHVPSGAPGNVFSLLKYTLPSATGPSEEPADRSVAAGGDHRDRGKMRSRCVPDAPWTNRAPSSAVRASNQRRVRVEPGLEQARGTGNVHSRAQARTAGVVGRGRAG